MFENPFKKQAPKQAQENTPTNKIEGMQDFINGKLEDMKSLFTTLESQFDALGENVGNLKLSPALASRAKIVLPVFMTVLATFGSVDNAEAQERDRYGLIKKTEKAPTQPGTQKTVQMTEQEWVAEQQRIAAEQKRQKDLKTGQDLRTAGMVTNIAAGVATTVGAMSRDSKVQNAMLITGSALNVTGTVLTVVGNSKTAQAGGGVQQGMGGNPGGRNMYGLNR